MNMKRASLSRSEMLRQAKVRLTEVGATIRHDDGEYRVNGRGWSEAKAYYTDDLDDAVATGLHMMKAVSQGYTSPGQ